MLAYAALQGGWWKTHTEDPWLNTFRNQTIDVMSIRDFFSKMTHSESSKRMRYAE